MGKHEIRLRRQKLTARGADRYRNYGAVLKEHEEEKRIKKIVRVFTYFLIIAFVVILLIILSRWENRENQKKVKATEISYTSKVALTDHHSKLNSN